MKANFFKNSHPKRFLKFSAVGIVNFVIDFSILNLLSFLTGINKGVFVAFFSAISFLVANFNSYFLNRSWTFKENNKNSKYKSFLAISVLGAVINIFIIYVFTTFISQPYFSDLAWLNISKIIATGLVTFLNYFGYKKFVFKNYEEK
ncbi:MAG: GtrA family protein [Patescibacteria group bacterium]|nr:GtrA family protein [Patescibacteria group bacterium]